MAGIKDFLTKNISSNASNPLDQLGIAAGIVELATAQNKLKAVWDIIKQLTIGTLLWNVSMATAFAGMKKGIRSLLADTGSLEQALKKLAQIQNLQRVFAPLVGGAAQAKLKIAELVNFAASKNLKLAEVGQGAKALQIMTHGGYAGARALSEVADPAAGTGNSFENMAEAVGSFSAALSEGGNISGAVDQLRAMGAITEGTATHLNDLQKAGASSNEMFGALRASLQGFSGAAEKAKGDLDGINKAHTAAVANLQEKFASPFVESDIENTKNWTAAMVAIAPVVQAISEFIEPLVNGFSTLSSKIAKLAAESPAFRTALIVSAEAMAVLITAISFVATIGLSLFFIEAAVACWTTVVASTALAAALELVGVALAATGIGLLILALGTAVGVFLHFSEASDKAAQAIKDMQKASEDATSSIMKHIAAIKTLADYHNTLATSLDHVTDTQEALNKAMLDYRTGKVSMEEVQQRQADVVAAQKAVRAVQKTNTSALAPTKGELDVETEKIEKERQDKEASRQAQLQTASPERRATLLRQRAEELQSRANRAQVGVEARGAYSRATATSGTEVEEKTLEQKEKALQFAIDHPVNNLLVSEETKKARIVQLTAHRDAAKHALDLKKEEQNSLGENAPRDSSVFQEYMERNAGDEFSRTQFRQEAARRKQEEQNAPNLSAEATSAAAEARQAEQERKLIEAKLRAEAKIADSGRRGFELSEEETRNRLNLIAQEKILESQKDSPNRDRLSELYIERANIEKNRALNRERMASTGIGIGVELATSNAQVSGNAGRLKQLNDFSIFKSKFDELIGQGIDQSTAKRIAGTFASNAITLDARESRFQTGKELASTELARIGGGGNVERGSDPMLTAAQRQIQLQEEMTQYLSVMASFGQGGVSDPIEP